MINKKDAFGENKMKNFFIANWKMNGSTDFIHFFFQEFNIFQPCPQQEEVVFCPPALYGPCISSVLPPYAKLGAQDCHYENQGAFTGDISPLMLKENKYHYVIVGHSERRTRYLESNHTVQNKALRACQAGLIPIICVGENQSQRLSGNAIPFILKQLEESLPHTSSPVLIAYEPLWAIGTGQVANLEDIESMHAAIKVFLKENSAVICHKDGLTPILYGGSVTPLNAKDILSLPSVNGVLVGGASLKAKTFMSLIENCRFMT